MNKTFWAATAGLIALAMAPAAQAATDLPPLNDAAAEYGRRAALAEPARCTDGETLDLAVEPAAGDIEARIDAATGRLRVLYRMAFNQVTEGWNWHPEARPEQEDYYRYKYVLLKSVPENRGSYRFEDKIGTPQDFAVLWRYDYFFAFDNAYDFYARGTDDDTGFAADLALPRVEAERLAAGDLRMRLRVRLAAPCLTDSTTFYKATYGRPVDFTLKKRYLMGTLDEVQFYDAATQRTLAQLRKNSPAR